MNTLYTSREKGRRFCITVENILIVLIAVFSVFVFILTFFPLLKISKEMQLSFEMGRMVQRAFSIILFVLSGQLWKRKSKADTDFYLVGYCGSISECGNHLALCNAWASWQ